jgi:excisionase family DNA binding protein
MDMAMFIRATELFMHLLRAVETGWRGEQETCRIILSRWGIDVQVTLESLRRGRQEPGQNGGVQRREEGLCTKREVCSYLGLGVRTLDRWIQRGLLEPVRITRRTVYVRVEEVRALLRKGVGQNPGRERPVKQG